jgi:heat shock protein HslJ
MTTPERRPAPRSVLPVRALGAALALALAPAVSLTGCGSAGAEEERPSTGTLAAGQDDEARADGTDARPAADAPAADKPAENVSPSAALPLTGTEWQVASVTVGGETVRAAADVVGRLVIGDDGTLGIRACNSMGGTAERLGAGSLALEVGMSTRALCLGPQQDLEDAVTAFVDGTADYRVTGARLVLSKPNGDRMELDGVAN